MSVHTLLLRLAGPMQAWGTQSRFSVRDTGLEPSKSGVVGLLCAALGRRREEPLEDLDILRLGVRVDREGIMARDYHTTLGVMKAKGTPPPKNNEKHPKFTVVSTRYYLADANFLVGMEGEKLPLLQEIEEALQSPCWPLFLGRKSFPPAIPVWIPGGLQKDTPLEEALRSYPYPVEPRPEDGRIRLVMETAYGKGEAVRCDRPLSFAKRQFTLRHIGTSFINIQDLKIKEDSLCISLA